MNKRLTIKSVKSLIREAKAVAKNFPKFALIMRSLVDDLELLIAAIRGKNKLQMAFWHRQAFATIDRAKLVATA